MFTFVRACCLVVAAVLAGCASTGEHAPASRAGCSNCGRIIDISQLQPASGYSVGRSTVPGVTSRLSGRGAGVGGVLGNRSIGSMPVPEVTPFASELSRAAFSVKVLMDEGAVRTVWLDDIYGLAVGQRVRLIGDEIVLDHTRGAVAD